MTVHRLALLALVCVALAACRSDGGLDRADSEPSLRFATSKLAQHTREDAQATRTTFESIPAAVKRSFSDGAREMTATYYLYLEDHAAKPKEASASPGERPETYIRQR